MHTSIKVPYTQQGQTEKTQQAILKINTKRDVTTVHHQVTVPV